jgi:hypothetical protein
MFGFRPTENGRAMALDQDAPQLNTDAQPQDARPEDPERNTQPRGNGDHDERDTEKGRDKLDSVLGQ